MSYLPENERLLTPAQAARLIRESDAGMFYRAHSRLVQAWADQGRLRSTRTLGGHRRIYLTSVREMLAAAQGRPKT